ncbi:hypothetical protein CSA80_00285 [Candidatus Saccharibacteria bacterium]|nr:MAG: hypothetical protein CSA80_00285 [Candidatus Saccharibacteria bacterium]
MQNDSSKPQQAVRAEIGKATATAAEHSAKNTEADKERQGSVKSRLWQSGQAILWTAFLFFASQLAAAFVVVFILTAFGQGSQQASDWVLKTVAERFLYVLTAGVLAVWGVVWLLRHYGKAWRDIGILGMRFGDIWWILQGYGAYLVLFAVTFFAVHAFMPAINTEQQQQIGFETNIGGVDLALVFVSLVILPPLVEEIIFRGYLFTSLRRHITFVQGAIVTSILFGIAHLQFGSGEPLLWIAAIDTFMLSMVLCYVREKSGSLWPGIFIHAIKNSVAFSFLFVFKEIAA